MVDEESAFSFFMTTRAHIARNVKGFGGLGAPASAKIRQNQQKQV
jgi:hypothetical protein